MQNASDFTALKSPFPLITVADWSDESVSSAEILRLIYQGRFLHGNVTLAALGLPTGKTTVMHLVPRESLPEPNSQGIDRYPLTHLIPADTQSKPLFWARLMFWVMK